MDPTRFDRWARRVATNRLSRRTVLHAGAAGILAGTLGIAGRGTSVLAQSATPPATAATPCPVTTEAENAAIARRWYEDALNGRNLDVLDEIVDPNIPHDAALFPGESGRDALKRDLAQLLTVFPDIQFSEDAIISDGDIVAVHWTGRGTHKGTFLGVPATGKAIVFTGINTFRIACGRIVEGSSEADGVGLFQQFGVLPGPATPTAAIASPASAGLAATPACQPADKATTKAIAQRWFQEAVNPHQLAALDDILSPDIVDHATTFADAHGVGAVQQLITAVFTAFPDIKFTVTLTAVQGDLVVERWTATGTHRGVFQGIAPTGKRVTWTGTNIYRIDCGKIVEIWNETDGISRLQQLGAMPVSGVPAFEATPAP